MNPLFVLLAVGTVGAIALGGKKQAKVATAPKVSTPAATAPAVTVTVPTVAPGEPAQVPPIKVTLPALPTDDDYPSKPPSGDLSPMLTQSEQYSLENYSNDQLYNEGMSSGHLAYVAAIGTKLAASGDTRAGDMTLRVAHWGK